MVNVDSCGNLASTLYRKPTAGISLLWFNSAHPHSLKGSIPFAQYLRIRRLCSSDNEFKTQAHVLQTRLLARGYSISLLKKAYKHAWTLERQNILYTHKEPPSQEVRCILTYCRQHQEIRDILRKYWFLLKEDTVLFDYVAAWPSITYRKCKSLKDKLVSSHIQNLYRRDSCTEIKKIPCGECPKCPFFRHQD